MNSSYICNDGRAGYYYPDYCTDYGRSQYRPGYDCDPYPDYCTDYGRSQNRPGYECDPYPDYCTDYGRSQYRPYYECDPCPPESTDDCCDTNGNTSRRRDGFHEWVDVSEFRLEEICVKLENNVVVVHAKQVQANGRTSELIRRYVIPKPFQPEDVIACLSADGILSISVPSKVRCVPIQQTGISCRPDYCVDAGGSKDGGNGKDGGKVVIVMNNKDCKVKEKK